MCACGHVGRVMASCAQRRPYCSDPDSWCRRRGRCNSGQRNRTSCQNPRRAASAWEGLLAQRTKHTPQAHAAAAHVCAGRVEGRELHRLILDRNAERAEPVVTCTMWRESAVAGHAVQRRRAHARGTGTDLGGGNHVLGRGTPPCTPPLMLFSGHPTRAVERSFRRRPWVKTVALRAQGLL